MPLFEFACQECGQNFEELVRSTDRTEEIICPACAGTNVKKKISSFASKISGSSSFSFSPSSSSASCSTGST